MVFLLFLILHCSAKFARLAADGAKLLEAGRCLVRLVAVWQSAAGLLSGSQIQETFDAWNKFLFLTQDFGELLIPKRHLVAHLLSKQAWHGNPRRYAVWRDESLNKCLKKCCQTISQVSFEPHILLRMPEILRRQTAKRRYPGED